MSKKQRIFTKHTLKDVYWEISRTGEFFEFPYRATAYLNNRCIYQDDFSEAPNADELKRILEEAYNERILEIGY